MKCSFHISNFLEAISILSILLFSSISLHWSLRKSFLSLLAILWNSAFRWVYLSFSPLPLASLLFSAICKASSDSHFSYLHVFFLSHSVESNYCDPMHCSPPGYSVHGITQAWTSVIVLQAICLSDLIHWIYSIFYIESILYIEAVEDSK